MLATHVCHLALKNPRGRGKSIDVCTHGHGTPSYKVGEVAAVTITPHDTRSIQ